MWLQLPRGRARRCASVVPSYHGRVRNKKQPVAASDGLAWSSVWLPCQRPAHLTGWVLCLGATAVPRLAEAPPLGRLGGPRLPANASPPILESAAVAADTRVVRASDLPMTPHCRDRTVGVKSGGSGPGLTPCRRSLCPCISPPARTRVLSLARRIENAHQCKAFVYDRGQTATHLATGPDLPSMLTHCDGPIHHSV